MNSTATALTFQSKTFEVVQREGQVWLTLPDIAAVLYRKGVSPSDAPLPSAIRQIQKIYQNHSDEFTESMTKMLKLSTAGGKQMVRVFSLRGAHLIAMFARTDVAKAFRRWVLDILDRQFDGLAAQASIAARLDEDLLQSIQSLCTHTEYLNSWWNRVAPGLRLLSSRLAGVVHDDFVHAVIASRQVVRGLGLKSETRCAAGYPWEAGYTERSMYVERMRRELA